MTTNPVDLLCEAIEAGRPPAGVFAADAVVDATVPNWRFAVHGDAAITLTMAGWFADPGHFDELSRTPLPDGELLEFTLSWMERGVPHACHQAHVLAVSNGLVVRDTVFCGGRWSAGLLAEMEAAAQS